MTVELADGLAAPVACLLAEVDWDFPQRIMHSPIEGIHPYPAKFVAELPRALLDALPVPSGTAVLDPFCGSGTTLVECQRRGLLSVGIDLNPIACLMTRVKTSPQPVGLKEAAAATVALARSVREVKVPQIPNLGRVHTFERFNDECEADEEGEHHIQLVEPRKDAAESLQSAKEPLHFIAFLILLSVVRPRFTAIALGRHDRSRS